MRVPRRVAQAKRKPRRDASGRNLRGEWFSPGELLHDVGERGKNKAQVLLGQSGTQEDAKLMPQTLVVEVEGTTNPGGAILWGAQLHPLESLNNGAGVGCAGRADRTGICSSPSLAVTMKSRLPKRTSALGTHPPEWLAIRSLKRSTRHAQGPIPVRQLSVFRTVD
jgi:hypothetical protein